MLKSLELIFKICPNWMKNSQYKGEIATIALLCQTINILLLNVIVALQLWGLRNRDNGSLLISLLHSGKLSASICNGLMVFVNMPIF